MALLFGNKLKSCLRSYPQMALSLVLKRFARSTPVQKTFTIRDDVRMEKYLKKTYDRIAGNEIRSKKSNRNTVESILNSLQSGSGEYGVKLSNVTIKKLPKDVSPRMRQIGTVFYNSITSLFQSGEICENLTELGFEVTDVTYLVKKNMNMVIVSWNSINLDNEKKLLELLPESSPKIRQALSSMNIIGFIPPVLFYKDVSIGRQTELDHLLSIADLGPEEDRLNFDHFQNHNKDLDPSDIHNNIYGVNHDNLKNEVLNAKRRVPGRIYVESAINKEILTIDIEKA